MVGLNAAARVEVFQHASFRVQARESARGGAHPNIAEAVRRERLDLLAGDGI